MPNVSLRSGLVLFPCQRCGRRVTTLYGAQRRCNRCAKGGTCQHCHAGPRTLYGRGLCSRCWRDFAIRALYAPLNGYRRHRPKEDLIPDCNGIPPLPTTPTTAWPGSEEKMAVLAARAQAGLAIFHPLDVTLRPAFPGVFLPEEGR